MKRSLALAALLVLFGAWSAEGQYPVSNAGIFAQGNLITWYGEASAMNAQGNVVDISMSGNLTLFQEQIINGTACCGSVISYYPWTVAHGTWSESFDGTVDYDYCYASAVVAQTAYGSDTKYSDNACITPPPCDPNTNPSCCDLVSDPSCGCDPTTDPSCCDPSDPTCGCDPSTDPSCCDPATDPTCGCDPSTDPTCGGCDPSTDPTCGGCDPSDPYCGSGGDCDPDTDPNCCDLGCDDNQNDPLVINLNDGPWRLTGVHDPVRFDIHANGQMVTLGWTARESKLAFLALDRNGNGTIDDGSELFGNATPLPSGHRAPNGFVALAQYDTNHDGVVDKNDAIWKSLMLWVDGNHDGICQPDELTPISTSTITRIYIARHWTGRRDKSGNYFRYRGHVRIGKHVRSIFDVFFVPVH